MNIKYDIVHVSQLDEYSALSNNDCGPASLLMCYKTLYPDSHKTVDDIYKGMNLGTAGFYIKHPYYDYTDMFDIAYYLGLKFSYFSWTSIDNMKQLLIEKRPFIPIVSYYPAWSAGLTDYPYGNFLHFVVVTGFNDEKGVFYVNDPLFETSDGKDVEWPYEIMWDAFQGEVMAWDDYITIIEKSRYSKLGVQNDGAFREAVVNQLIESSPRIVRSFDMKQLVTIYKNRKFQDRPMYAIARPSASWWTVYKDVEDWWQIEGWRFEGYWNGWNSYRDIENQDVTPFAYLSGFVDAGFRDDEIENCKRFIQFEVDRARFLDAKGYKSNIGNFAVGNPKKEWWPIIRPLVEVSHEINSKYSEPHCIVGWHEYAAGFLSHGMGINQREFYVDNDPVLYTPMDSPRWLIGRCMDYWEEQCVPNNLTNARFAITEFGIDNADANALVGVVARHPELNGLTYRGFEDNGFITFSKSVFNREDYRQFYLEQLTYWAEQYPDYVLGVCVFLHDNRDEKWNKYNIEPIATKFYDHVKNYVKEVEDDNMISVDKTELEAIKADANASKTSSEKIITRVDNILNEEPQVTYYKTTTNLRLRATPVTGTILLVIPTGKYAEFLGVEPESGWYNVIYDNKTGYCSPDYMVGPFFQ